MARLDDYVAWLLEHGGVVDTQAEDRCCYTRDGITTVRLDWIYQERMVAPQYEFPTDALNALFYGSRSVQPGGTQSASEVPPTEIARSEMGAKYRFSAQLTPWAGPGGAPYADVVSAGRFSVRCPKELCYMSNSEFKFLSSGSSSVYSYHLRGFVRP